MQRGVGQVYCSPASVGSSESRMRGVGEFPDSMLLAAITKMTEVRLLHLTLPRVMRD